MVRGPPLVLLLVLHVPLGLPLFHRVSAPGLAFPSPPSLPPPLSLARPPRPCCSRTCSLTPCPPSRRLLGRRQLPEGSYTASEPRRRRGGRSGLPSPPPCTRHPAISSASCSTLDASTTPHGDTSAGTVLERRACPTNAPHSSEAANHT